MVYTNSESTLEFDPFTNYVVTPYVTHGTVEGMHSRLNYFRLYRGYYQSI